MNNNNSFFAGILENNWERYSLIPLYKLVMKYDFLAMFNCQIFYAFLQSLIKIKSFLMKNK